jgi:hypothetical protein
MEHSHSYLYTQKIGASFVLADCLYAAGGGDASTRGSVERYDVATNTWTPVADMLELGTTLLRDSLHDV